VPDLLVDPRPAVTSSAPRRPTRGTRQSTLEYRPHLDGLRAVAVLAVFVFHAVPSRLTGGFVGVDVFFVLSGYLITLILLEQHSARGLSSFYVRRVKRLLPAALLLLLAVAVYESLWGSVLEFATRFGEIRATTLYAANWNLIDRSDEYFAESQSASPLRHMWSLAVEEQFYFVWPVLLIGLLWLFRRRLAAPAAAAIALATASIVAMIARYSPANVARAYYGTDTRVFQPLLGAALAIVTVRLARTSTADGISRQRSPMAPVAAAVIGVVGFIVLGVMAFTLAGGESAYFRFGALVVAVAAGAVIWSLERSAALAAVIGWWPLALLGQISYGVYLWHWPIILWLRPSEGADWIERRMVNVAQLLLTLLVAGASFLLVERPLRRRPIRGPGWHVFGVAAVAMALVIGSSSWLLRPPTSGSEAIATAAIDDPSVQACPDQPHPCVQFEPGDPAAPTVVLVGDSTAQMYRPAMLALAEQHRFRYVQAAMGGCPIGDRLLATGIDGELHKPSNFMCADAIPGNYEEAVAQWSPALVIATSSNEANQHVTDGQLVERGTEQHRDETRAALEQSVDVLTNRGARLVFLAVLPGGPAVTCLDASPPDGGTCIRPVPDPHPYAEVDQIFTDIAAERGEVVGVVDLIDVVCPGGGQCPLMIDGTVVRYDGGHFTGTWSQSLAPVLEQRFNELGVDLDAL
jgi:peptidoglycan/LPS O-acetylase OafA/YrhL